MEILSWSLRVQLFRGHPFRHPRSGPPSLRMIGQLLLAVCLLVPAATSALAQSTFVAFDSGQVRPLALSPDGNQLFAVNTPDGVLEIFNIAPSGSLSKAGSVQVGLEPVAVAARSNGEVWVVNYLSDSVSVVDLSGPKPRVVRTLHTGDEPSDIVFAGPGGNRAFITAAHRGQNTPTPDGDFDIEGIGRADIWVFDATNLGSDLGGSELTIITVFGDKPRALAVSNDGATVYAAVFHSGNQTTTINPGYICPTSGTNLSNDVVEPSCSLDGGTSPGGTPPPHQNQEGTNRPEVGMIVKWKRDGVTNAWQDELGRNWNSWVKFSLPDRDVFAINANSNPPAAIDGSSGCSNGSGCWAGVGTTIFNMAVNPISGKIYVSNTDAQNHVRFEGPGTLAGPIKPVSEPATVQGNLAQSQITVLDGSNVNPRHLNKHLDYSLLPAPVNDKAKSLATPTGMVISADGATLYVAALGSSKVGIFSTSELEADTFTPDAADHILLAGGGTSGLALNTSNSNRLYVMTRFNNSISVVDPVAKTELQVMGLHNAEPASVVDGRPFLYDSTLTSSNGEASCSSCHIAGDMDDLAWDLGNPDDDTKANTNPFNDDPFSALLGGLTSCFIQNFLFADGCELHPMKGPMTTQSLRGLDLMGPQHWRGDRLGDAVGAFLQFNGAFPGLVGNGSQLSGPDMQTFTDFAMQIRYPPNPIRNLENNLTTIQNQGLTVFNEPNTDQIESCNGCHSVDGANGFFGADGQSTFDGESQIFKIPHLRNMYQKIGMFGNAEPDEVNFPLIGTFTAFDGPFTNTGDQVRGFGFTHDGSVDSLFRFVSSSLFVNVTNTEQSRVEAFMLAIDTDLAPIVGQQITLTSTNSGTADPRVGLMIQRCSTNFISKVMVDVNGGAVNECDLIAKLTVSGTQRGYLFDAISGDFTPDDGGPDLSDAALRLEAATGGQEITYTAVPPGSGFRMALDRDEDGLLDGVETGTGVFVNASDTGTDADAVDTDLDGISDFDEVAGGSDPNDFYDPIAEVPLLSRLSLALFAGIMLVGGIGYIAKNGPMNVS